MSSAKREIERQLNEASGPLYVVVSQPLSVKLLREARETNRRRDAMERDAGFGAPGDGTLADHLRTAMCAVSAGLDALDWMCVAEGLAMMEQVELSLRGEGR